MRATLLSSSLRTILGLTVLIGLLSRPSLQTCGKGCLSCTEDVEAGTTSCDICDIFLSYVKAFDGTCEEKLVENCEIPSLDHFAKPCLQCKPNYVLDIVQGKCVSINFSLIVPDCLRYSSISTCVSCNPDHYITIGKCMKSEKLIPDCVYYSTEGVCSQCVTEKFLDKDINECRDFPKATGCLMYNNLRCDQCKAGYAQDLNFYLRFTPSTSTVQSLAIENTNFTQFSQINDENCFKMNVPNCHTHESADSCLKCDANYFVTEDRKCEAYPQNQRSNCMIYSSKTTCQECEFLYKLDGNDCVRRTLITDCVKYQITNDLCAECSIGKYVTGGGASCTTRGNSSTGCKEFTKLADTCAVCEPNHSLGSNGVCFPNVAHCKTHELNSGAGNFKKCTECIPEYFLPGGTVGIICTQVMHLKFCKTRTANANTCATCETGYYNHAEGCKYYTVDFCNTFEAASDECTDCIEGFEKISNVCKAIELNNCATPSSTVGECTTCVEGFYKDAGNKCRMRNLVGCKVPTANENKCTTCHDLYFKEPSDNLCYQKHIANCKTSNITADGCTDCELTYFINEFGTCSKDLTNVANCTDQSPDNTYCNSCTNPLTHYLEPILSYCLARTNTANCATYVLNADVCLTCTGNFYLKGGKCIAQTASCASIGTNTNDCSTCGADLYLDPVTKTCLPNMKDNCVTQADSSGFGCKKCSPGYYLNTRTKLCEQGFLPHCATYFDFGTSADYEHLRCATCEDGSYLQDYKCFKNASLGCTDTLTTASGKTDQDLCTACKQGFYLKSGKCLIQNIPNCQVFHATTNVCTTCQEGYYLKSGTTNKCFKQYNQNCVTITPGTNDCVLCENLYQLTLANSPLEDLCSRITKNNCVKSNGVADACVICAPGYKTSTGDCIVITETYHPVEHCLGNNTTNDSSCEVCKNDFKSMSIKKVLAVLPPNCVRVSSTNEFLCSQCAEQFEMEPTSNGVCKRATYDPANVCVQVIHSQTTTLTGANAANHCAKCANYNTHYLTGGSCSERTMTLKCSEYDPTSDNCLKCKSPNNLIAMTSSDITCQTISSVKANCLVHEVDGGNNCISCIAGKSGNDCSTNTKLDFPLAFWGLNFATANTAVTPQTDFDTYTMGVLSGKTLTGKTNASGQIPMIDLSIVLETPYNSITKVVDYNTLNLGSLKQATISATASWINLTIAGAVGADCTLMVEDENNKYNCIACSTTKVGKAEKRDTTNKTYTQMTQCLLASNFGLSKSFSGAGYLGDDILSGTTEFGSYASWGQLVTFDTCTNGRVPVAYFYKNIPDSPNRSYLSPLTFASKITVMECVDKVHSTYEVDGCQVYGFIDGDHTKVPNVIYSTNQNVKCLACKPGYSGSNFGIEEYLIMPGTCTAIEHCDMGSPLNNKMNYCGRCKSGYAWEYSDLTLTTMMHKCVASPDNCEVYDATISECKLCSNDFTLNDNRECVAIADANCTTAAVQSVDYGNKNIDTISSKTYLSGIFTTYNYAVSIATDKAKLYCGACTGGKHPAYKAALNQKNCVYNSIVTVLNCSEYKYNTIGGLCAVCNDGYILNTSNSKCESADKIYYIKNCKETSAGNLLVGKCDKCVDNYYLNKNKICVEMSGCSELASDGSCTLCKSGFYKKRVTGECEQVPEESVCAEMYNFKDGDAYMDCLACKNPALVPVNSHTDSNFHFDCVPNTLNVANTLNFWLYDYDPTGVATIASNGVNTNLDSALGGATYTDTLTAALVPTTTTIFNSVLPVSSQITQLESNVNAISPTPHYSVKIAFSIVKNTANNSIAMITKYKDDAIAASTLSTALAGSKTKVNLDPTHVKMQEVLASGDASLAASIRFNAACINTKALIKEHHPAETASINTINAIITINSSIITAISNANSASATAFADLNPLIEISLSYSSLVYTHVLSDYALSRNGVTIGALSDSGSYLSPTKVCMPKLSSIQNCAIWSEANNNCETCFEGYFNDSGDCKKGRFPFCLEYSDINTCSKCLPTHFLNKFTATSSVYADAVMCTPYTKTCETFQPNADGCMTCKPFYFLNVTATPYVCTVMTVTNCSVFHPTLDQCLICSHGYFHAAKVCTPITIANCGVFSSQTDTCVTCREGFYLDTQKKCQPHTNFNCVVYSEVEDACELCPEGFFLNGNGRCEQSDLLGCEVPKSNEKKCSLCASGYWLDPVTALCQTHTVQHCSIFNRLKNECITCDHSSYRSTTGVCLEYSSAVHCETFHPNKDECITCLAGFFHATDLKCKQYTMPSCKTYNLTEDKCTSCFESFYLDVSANKFHCLPITATNCAEFSVSENRCSLCFESYFLDIGTGNCTFYSVQNCEQYHPYRDQCSTCTKGHFLNSSLNCSEYTTSGCASFSVNSDACISCRNGFYFQPSTLTCSPYTVENCTSFQLQDNKCSSCLPGFYLTNGKCTLYTVSNCAKNDALNDRCSNCVEGYYQSAGKCLKFTVKNCKDFMTKVDKCKNCLPGYFFEHGQCFEYTAKNCLTLNPSKDLCDACDHSTRHIFKNSENIHCEEVTEVKHCNDYSEVMDLCSMCDEGFYLENKMCHLNPTGIPKCSVYSSAEKCEDCELGSYLSNNTCITPQVPILGCADYSSELCCESCNATYALTSSFTCEKAIENSCASLADPYNCATCPTNMILQKNTDNNMICVSSGIQYCSEAVNSSAGAVCNLCNQGYFLNDGQTKCLWPETLVENCLNYSGHGICSRCKDMYLLSKDNSKCTNDIATVGSNCLVGHVSDKPKCSRCKGGFYFDDSGICQMCSDTVKFCAVCDINNLSRCLVCEKGYFMNADFTCEMYPPPEVVDIGVNILRFAVMGLIALMMML